MTASAAATSNEIGTTRVFDAPRDLVFRMFTDPEHVARWWGPRGFSNTIESMDVRPGGEWKFVMHGPDGRDYQNHIRYVEVTPPSRIVFDHVSGPLFQATIDFADEGEKTRVSMRMEFENAEIRNRVAEEFGAVEGQQQTLDKLGEHLAAVKDETFVISRTFDAPRDLMWKVWTETEHMQEWFGPKGAKTIAAKNDFRPGGTYHYGMEMPDGMRIWGKWTYREIVKPERLVFVSAFSDENGGLGRHPMAPDWPPQMMSNISFLETDGRTTVTVMWSPLDATEVEKKMFREGMKSMTGGWSGTFDRLAGYLKNEA